MVRKCTKFGFCVLITLAVLLVLGNLTIDITHGQTMGPSVIAPYALTPQPEPTAPPAPTSPAPTSPAPTSPAPTSPAPTSPARPTIPSAQPQYIPPIRRAPSGNPWIFKTVYPQQARVGDLMDFTLTVTNDYGRSRNIVVRDDLGCCFRIVKVTSSWGSVQIKGTQVTVDIGTLYRDDVVTIHIVAEVLCKPQEATCSCNVGCLCASSGQDVLADNAYATWYTIDDPAPLPTSVPQIEENMIVPPLSPTPIPTSEHPFGK